MTRLRDYNCSTAIILGSGLGSIVVSPIDTVSYSEFPEIPKTTIAGHAGKFSVCELGDKRVLFAQGRVHLYEGHDVRAVTSIVRVLADAGIKQLIITNSAGGVNESFRAGDWMMINGHLNLTGTSPLIGSANFLDLSDAYSPRMRAQFSLAAKQIGMTLREGVYAALIGPQYETPAEVQMLRKFGADAVGMSTVLEVIQARALGLEVAAFSCIANAALDLHGAPISHDEVLRVGTNAAAHFSKLLNQALPGL